MGQTPELVSKKHCAGLRGAKPSSSRRCGESTSILEDCAPAASPRIVYSWGTRSSSFLTPATLAGGQYLQGEDAQPIGWNGNALYVHCADRRVCDRLSGGTSIFRSSGGTRWRIRRRFFERRVWDRSQCGWFHSRRGRYRGRRRQRRKRSYLQRRVQSGEHVHRWPVPVPIGLARLFRRVHEPAHGQRQLRSLRHGLRSRAELPKRSLHLRGRARGLRVGLHGRADRQRQLRQLRQRLRPEPELLGCRLQLRCRALALSLGLCESQHRSAKLRSLRYGLRSGPGLQRRPVRRQLPAGRDAVQWAVLRQLDQRRRKLQRLRQPVPSGAALRSQRVPLPGHSDGLQRRLYRHQYQLQQLRQLRQCLSFRSHLQWRNLRVRDRSSLWQPVCRHEFGSQ